MHKRTPKTTPPAGNGEAFAAIDLGTNNCRMLIARPTPVSGQCDTGFSVIDSFSRIVRLGEGIHNNDCLDEKAQRRTLSALKACAGKLRKNRVARVRAVATEACRRAKDSEQFLGRVRDETGIHLEPITPAEEAELTLRGCQPLLDPTKPRTLLFDIGGGSTEVIWIDTTAPHNNGTQKSTIIAMQSLPIGVVTVAERFGGTGTLSDADCETILNEVDCALHPFDAEHNIRKSIEDGTVHMIGTSGTVTSLGGVFLELDRYDRSRVDGMEMDFSDITSASMRLKSMSTTEREAHPCIGHGRADLSLPGCAILAAILRRWPVGQLRAADRGIREGILLDLMAGYTSNGAIGATQ